MTGNIKQKSGAELEVGEIFKLAVPCDDVEGKAFIKKQSRVERIYGIEEGKPRSRNLVKEGEKIYFWNIKIRLVVVIGHHNKAEGYVFYPKKKSAKKRSEVTKPKRSAPSKNKILTRAF